MQLWLRCRVTPGQFDNEYAVSATQSNGKVFSLFAPRDAVWCEVVPAYDHPAEGLLRVEVWKKLNGTMIIALPRPSLEAGRFVTVNASQLQEEEPAAGGVKG